MIVVDSSVWIANSRGLDIVPVYKLREAFHPNDILLGDLIIMEILQGFRDEKSAKRMERYLRTFEIASMGGADIAIAAARNYRLLRRKGITIRKVPDVLIATFCIEHGHRLLQHDRDFLPFAEHLGLELA